MGRLELELKCARSAASSGQMRLDRDDTWRDDWEHLRENWDWRKGKCELGVNER